MIYPKVKTQLLLRPFFTALVFILLTIIIDISCTHARFRPPPNIPLNYLKCIELTTDRLEHYYLNYDPIYFWLPTGEEVLDGRPVIIKNIELTNGIVDEHNSRVLHITEKITMYLTSVYQMEGIRFGEAIDIVGICRGFSKERDSIILTECFMEPSGTLGLPVDGSNPGSLFGY
jgi:hypothetical protein